MRDFCVTSQGNTTANSHAVNLVRIGVGVERNAVVVDRRGRRSTEFEVVLLNLVRDRGVRLR
ncbi:hypothetical protein D3C85_1807370 [compost metagenome]